MTHGETSKIKFIVKQPIFENGPNVEWAVILLSPANEIMVAGWVNL